MITEDKYQKAYWENLRNHYNVKRLPYITKLQYLLETDRIYELISDFNLHHIVKRESYFMDKKANKDDLTSSKIAEHFVSFLHTLGSVTMALRWREDDKEFMDKLDEYSREISLISMDIDHLVRRDGKVKVHRRSLVRPCCNMTYGQELGPREDV
jgi:CRISPR/Cas system-associated protein Cas10 (large subunit of type III CRISPR-Cas system)